MTDDYFPFDEAPLDEPAPAPEPTPEPIPAPEPEYALFWTGVGFLVGIPANHLTADQVALYGGADYLISTGLYTPTPQEG
jgi:hypothetical protein